MKQVINHINEKQSKLQSTFDELTHTYRVNGKTYLSVTQLGGILSSTIGDVPKRIMDEAISRGKEVHKLTEDYDCGIITYEDILYEASSPKVSDQVTLYTDYTANIAWLAIEFKVYNEVLRVAGTLDRLGIDENGELCILDIKSGKYGQYHAVQLVTYAMIISEAAIPHPLKFNKLMLLSLHLEEHRLVNVMDEPNFSAWLDVAKSNMKQRHYAVHKNWAKAHTYVEQLAKQAFGGE